MVCQRKKFYYLLLLFSLLPPSSLFAADLSGRNDWLSAVIFKLEKTVDDAGKNIAACDDQIRECDAAISQTENLVTRAAQKGNVMVEQRARQALAVTQETRNRNSASKNAAEAVMGRTAQALTNVRNAVAALSSVDAEIQAVVSNYSGRAMYISQRLKGPVPLGARGSGGLETGDEITTDADGRAQIQCLDGRGAVDIGENTKLKFEQGDSGSQVMGLVQGRIHIAVEKVEDFEKGIEERLASYKDSLVSLGKLTEREIETALGKMRARIRKFAKKFEVRTGSGCCAIRGTQLSISVDGQKGKEFAVFEGTVEIRAENNPKMVLLNAGYRMKASVDGTLSGPEKIDTAETDRWWEK
jgi:hypothetical protein